MRVIGVAIGPDVEAMLFRNGRGTVEEQQQRQLAMWCAYELGETTVEIAAALGCTHQNVSWAINAVKQRLRSARFRKTAFDLRVRVRKDLGL